MVKHMMATSIAILLAISALAAAEKDSSYYPAGMWNPNIDEPMYWKDAANVLEDIGKFRALYVKFHSCVESYYADGCGAGGNEEGATWYMGYSECTRANVGYSLYGELAGAESSGCSKATYINSFFTTTGVETFTAAIENTAKVFTAGSSYDDDYAGGVTSQCTTVYSQNQQGDDQNQNNNDYGTHGSKLSPYDTAVSFGIGCNGKKFNKKSFEGAFCDKHSVMGTSDRLKTFNSEMKSLDCVQIYSKYANAQNGNGGDQKEDGSGLDLLAYSQACSIREFPRACPDPHGKLAGYTRALDRNTGVIQNKTARLIKDIFSYLFLVLGTACFVLGLAAVYVRERRRIFSLRRRKKEKRGSAKGSSSSKVFRRPSRSSSRGSSRGVSFSRSRSRSRSRK